MKMNHQGLQVLAVGAGGTSESNERCNAASWYKPRLSLNRWHEQDNQTRDVNTNYWIVNRLKGGGIHGTWLPCSSQQWQTKETGTSPLSIVHTVCLLMDRDNWCTFCSSIFPTNRRCVSVCSKQEWVRKRWTHVSTHWNLVNAAVRYETIWTGYLDNKKPEYFKITQWASSWSKIVQVTYCCTPAQCRSKSWHINFQTPQFST